MKKNFERKIPIGEGVSVAFAGNEFSVKKDAHEIKRRFNMRNIDCEIKEGFVILSSKKATKRENKMMGSIEAHINNMVEGVKKPFIYKLEICNVHFPMTVKVEGGFFKIKNFLGERKDRTIKICDGADIKVNGNKIEVSSFDIEAAGQTAANLEKITKVKNRDRRIFQDGIFITEKPGRKI